MGDMVISGAPVSVLIDHGLDEAIVEKLVAAGIGTVERLGSMTPEELEAIPGHRRRDCWCRSRRQWCPFMANTIPKQAEAGDASLWWTRPHEERRTGGARSHGEEGVPFENIETGSLERDLAVHEPARRRPDEGEVIDLGLGGGLVRGAFYAASLNENSQKVAKTTESDTMNRID